MAVATQEFFKYINDFFAYRHNIYEISRQTVKSNRVDLNLFKNFIDSQNQKTICGPAVIDFQYYLKNQRHNCGASINRKIWIFPKKVDTVKRKVSASVFHTLKDIDNPV